MQKNNSPESDTVYHLTTGANVDSILAVGLMAGSSENHTSIRRRVNAVIDAARPEKVTAANIARESAVYAHPLLRKVSKNSVGARRGEDTVENPVAIGVDVDPDLALVTDKENLDHVAHLLIAADAKGQTVSDQAVAGEAAKRYWNDAVTLRDYRRYYDPDERIRNFKSFDTPMPYYIAVPEVLLAGPVPPEAVTWAASIVVDKVHAAA